jgi:hypothetical protein
MRPFRGSMIQVGRDAARTGSADWRRLGEGPKGRPCGLPVPPARAKRRQGSGGRHRD